MPTPQELLEESRRLEQIASKETGVPPVLGTAGSPLTSEQTQKITSADLTSVTAPNVVSPPPQLSPSIAGIKTTIPVISKPQNDLEKSLAEAEKLVAGLGTPERELQKRIGAQGISTDKEIAELNEQIEMNKAQELTLKERAEAKNVLDPFATGEAARAQKALAIDTLRLSSRANALQAKFGIAEKQARIAIDTEFAEKERDLRIKRQNIIANFDKMTPDQRKRAEALLLQLNKEDKFVSEQKKVKEEITKEIIKAIGLGAPKNITDKAFEAGSVKDAVSILAPYLKKKEEFAPGDIGEFQRLFGRTPSPQEFLEFKRQQAKAGRKEEKEKEGIPEINREDVQSMYNSLSSRVGSDGFISPQDWRIAKTAWIKEGFLAEDFDKRFSIFKNPTDIYL